MRDGAETVLAASCAMLPLLAEARTCPGNDAAHSGLRLPAAIRHQDKSHRIALSQSVLDDPSVETPLSRLCQDDHL